MKIGICRILTNEAMYNLLPSPDRQPLSVSRLASYLLGLPHRHHILWPLLYGAKPGLSMHNCVGKKATYECCTSTHNMSNRRPMNDMLKGDDNDILYVDPNVFLYLFLQTVKFGAV